MNSEQHAMRLYSTRAERLYLNRSERIRFSQSAQEFPPHIYLLCHMLLHTGCRLSEALNLRPCDLQVDETLVAVRSLKKRDKHHVREIPVPTEFMKELDAAIAKEDHQPIWRQSRTTAWRQIKAVMKAAEIYGAHASPKALRHSFGIHCAMCNIPMPLVQKWMGHSDIKTTTIYFQIVGDEEREMAKRLWN